MSKKASKKISAGMMEGVVARCNYDHYVNIAVSLIKPADIAMWHELKAANPNLKSAQIIKIALRELYKRLQ